MLTWQGLYEAHVRNARVRTLRHSRMAGHTHQAVRKMGFVRECDWLNGRGAPTQEIENGVNRGSMRWSENASGWIRWQRRSRCTGHGNAQQHQRARNGRGNDKLARPIFPRSHPEGLITTAKGGNLLNHAACYTSDFEL